MNRIVALIDGSGYSQSVCDHAGWVASHGDSSLMLLHVLGRRDAACDNADLSGSIGLGARTALLEELAELDGQKARLINKRGRAILDDARDRATAMGAGNITTMLRHGPLLATMEEFEEDSDLIVKMLIAFDGGSSSIKAVEHIVRSDMFEGLECMLIQVGSETSDNQKPLWGAVAALREAGFAAESRVIPGQPETVISDSIEADNFDLLVMGAYGHSRIRNLIIGSTTTQMIGACKVPIMLFR